MKKILSLLTFFLCFNFLYADNVDLNKTMKPHHKSVQISCKDCHGAIPKEKFKPVQTQTCLNCHKSKEFLAQRLDFLDKKNPHNSIHDGLNLNCYSCHNEHKPSYNMCEDCHNTSKWMREIK
ncbi:flavocytochrome c, heme subunit [Campylobacter sp. RM16704]|uniref:flavocytochrome c, heme subunit n=1 Tax=Campylobacter sp. RM16704 TaxID=1500960 RepID=UPI000581D223|nr:flavocytochrome c, heme subunit [Campylobacter sp. RM16704]AJC86436.1 cytochrome c3 [Campylobacter sp. RM16704]